MSKKEKNRRDTRISRDSSTNIYVPSCIFNKRLSSYETIVKFLKEGYGFSIQKISDLLNKKKQSVWRAYRYASLKFEESFEVTDFYFPIPIDIFKKTRLSLLESLVVFLKDHYGLSYSQVAILLMRDQRTIWTIYKRAKK